MIQQNDVNDRRSPPKIECEQDIPFVKESEVKLEPQSLVSKFLPDEKLSKVKDISKEITWFRFKTGRSVLFVSMIIMCLIVWTDLKTSNTEMHSDLLENAFEAFKLITMTVLGYIFGSDNSKN